MFADTKPCFEYTKEKDYNALLRQAKEKYEERLEAITDKVRIIYQEICEDEVLATMREDPTSRAFATQRVFEICEDNLALEREETIEKLMAELTKRSSSIIRLEKENKILHGALLKAEEKCANMGETQEMNSKLQEISREFEDKSVLMKSHKDEIDKLKAVIEETECSLWKKTTDFEVLLHDYNSEKNKNLELIEEIKNFEGNEKQFSKEQEIRSKNSRMKKKIIEQKAIVAKLETELESLKTVLETSKTNYEQSLKQVEEDLSKVRDTWELRCQELQTEHSNKTSSLQNSHNLQLKELQNHYQNLLDEKLNEFQTATMSQANRHKMLDEELSKKVEERVNEMNKDFISKAAHQQALNDHELNLKNKHSTELRDLEENLNYEFNSKVKKAREEHQEQIDKLKEKNNAFEEERSHNLLSQKKTEAELEFANQKIDNLNSRIKSLYSDIDYLEHSKRNLLQNIEETSLNLAKTRAQNEEEALKKQRIESELELERQKSKEFEQNFHEMSAKCEKQRSDMKNYEKCLQQEQTSNKELREEISILQENKKFKSAKEDLQKENTETKKLLKKAEKEIKYLNSQLESSLETNQAYKNQINKLEAELIELKRQVYSFQHISNDNESELLFLRNQNLRLKQIVSEIGYKSKESLSYLKSELKSTSRKTAKDLGTFKLNFIEEIGETLVNLQRSIKSKDRQISQKQQEIQSLSKMLKDSQDTLTLSIQEQSNYEASIKSLKDTISSLKKETQQKNQELNKCNESLQEISDIRRSLERENRRLEHELNNAQIEIDHFREESMDIHKQEQEFYDKQVYKFKGLAYSLREELDALEFKANGVFEQLQNELAPLHDSVAEDKVQLHKFKSEKNAEIETLRAEMKALNKEIIIKQELVEKAQEEKEIVRRREKREGTQQVLELKGKLAQSYHSTLETVKQARELERETHQLSMQAREEFRRSNTSLAHLRTSLEKY